MDHTIVLFLLAILTWAYFLTRQIGRQKSGHAARLPPGPNPLPIIGNILQLGKKPHHSLAAFADTYGPLMSLKLGTTTMIVVSSREMAQEFFLKNDLSFSGRWLMHAAYAHNRPETSMIWLQVGDKWRRLRRISKEHLFSVRQLDASQLLRKKKIKQLLDYVHECCENHRAVNIGETAATTALNFLSNFIFSIDLSEYDSRSSQEFKDLVWALMEVGGKPNLADYFPILQPLDPNGLLRQSSYLIEKLMAIFERYIKEHMQSRTKSSSDNSLKDLTDLLLDISEDPKSSINLNDIRNLIFDLFIAGSDTTSSTLEWAMAELIRNPEKMLKARSELEEVIGSEDRTMEESDISRLPYLQAIVKETLRLHPPVTFLVPHRAITDVEIQGYVVPKDSQIVCNLWAMGQDRKVWSEDAQTFRPERFLEVGIDYKGQDFELIPFGAGRRMCPGLPLAHRMLHLMLGSLIYRFEWKVEGEEVDMTDKFGFTLQKKDPLMAFPIKV